MSVFFRIADALSEPHLERALEQTLNVLARDLRLDAAWVWLLDEERNAFYLAAAFDLPPYLREPLHMTGEPCWCMQAFFNGEFTSRNVDVMSCSRLQEGIEEAGAGATRGLRSHASVALRFGDRALGLLNAARSQQPALSPHELETLETAGAQIGIAVERSRLAELAADAARAEERVSIARELHDTVVQDLTAVALHLENAAAKVQTSPHRAAERIGTALELTRAALESLRRNVEGLRDDPLAGETLSSALARLTREFISRTGIQVVLDLHIEGILPPNVEFDSYRIVSEALTNVERHAGARRVQISVRSDGQTLSIDVDDDGTGFDPAASSTGFGVRGMRERANALGGTLTIESSRETGTLVRAAMPVTSP
ncbi:MAG TPA: GAF domain-containing sensor histidine kinase [Candidatus Baltobacteraceae bacterium]|jgi:signal transduction histidine kinase|nr:GAF domain-containing sensor histidine kinase [Candidatus Baltobacteraceae bacterium]